MGQVVQAVQAMGQAVQTMGKDGCSDVAAMVMVNLEDGLFRLFQLGSR